MFASDVVLPDADVREALRAWRGAAPGAVRVLVPPFERFLAHGVELRPELAKGTVDSYLLMPRRTPAGSRRRSASTGAVSS